jgi:hypothetical protein
MPYANLPYDLILLILSYIHKPQNKELLHDIQHYVKTKKQILNIYKNQYNKNSYTYFLMVDILLFLNNNEDAVIYGYKDKCINVFLRNPFLSHNNVIKYIINLEQKMIHTEINIYWSLMSVCERNMFLCERNMFLYKFI